MKSFLAPRALFALFASCLLLPAVARADAEPNTGITLQVQIDFSGGRPAGDVAFVDALVARIRHTFSAHGYAGAVTAANDRESPNETAVLLKLNVTEVRAREQEVDCAFSASLRTYADEVQLGQYRVKDLSLRPVAERSGATEHNRGDESDSSMLRLFQNVARTKLVPGIATE